MKLLALCGSIRKASWNQKLLNLIAAELREKGHEVDVFDLRAANIPVYDQDLDATPPPGVVDLKNRAAAAQGFVICTPEYNYSVPGILKNVIDWVSRPYGQSNWVGKPGAIIGTSGGQVGTAIAQDHLRSILVAQGIALLGRPEVYFIYKEGVFDADNNVTDPAAKQILQGFVDAFAGWVAQQTHHH